MKPRTPQQNAVPGYLTFTTADGIPHTELEERLGRALMEARKAGAKEARDKAATNHG